MFTAEQIDRSLPSANPLVDIGFDSLDPDAIPAGAASLLAILSFYADSFVHIGAALHALKRIYDAADDGAGVARVVLRVEQRKNPKDADTLLGQIRTTLARFDLKVSLQHVDYLLDKIKRETFVKPHEIDELLRNIKRELGSRKFISIPTEHIKFFYEPFAGWEEIIKRFPDAQDDIEEMNKCYALSRYTAAVFHSLLVAEHGLIALGEYIGVTDPKAGWDATYKRLEALLKDRKAVPAGVDFSFIEQAKATIESMKHAWRNKVNHAAGKLALEKSGIRGGVAEEIIMATRCMMRQLAAKLP